MLILAGAVPLSNSSSADSAARAKRPYARAAIWATIFHHVTTGVGAYQHWIQPSHTNKAMAVGVYGCGGLALLGLLALFFGMNEDGGVKEAKKTT